MNKHSTWMAVAAAAGLAVMTGSAQWLSQASAEQEVDSVLRTRMTKLEFDGLTGRLDLDGYRGLSIRLATYLPWLTTGDLRDAITAPAGAGTRTAGGGTRGGGALEPSPGNPLLLGAPAFVQGGILLPAAWHSTYRLPGDRIDIFGQQFLVSATWQPLATRELDAGELLAQACDIFIPDALMPGWDGSGFFQAANQFSTFGDGVSDAYKRLVHGLDPSVHSAAGDTLGDSWKIKHGLDPWVWLDPDADPDGDGLSNFQEYLNDTNPFNADTDGDGVPDGVEVAQGSDPADPSDLGLPPPPDILQEVAFTIYTGYVSWELTVRGTSAGDRRVQRIIVPIAYYYGVDNIKLKLRKGCTYELSMRWLGCFPRPTHTSYGWNVLVDWRPIGATYQNYTSNRLPGVLETVTGPNWIAENADGLLTQHINQEGPPLTRNGGGADILAERLKATLNILKVEKPSGDKIRYSNSAIWNEEDIGLTFDCKISPDLPTAAEIYWTLDPADFPAGPETKITWDPWDVKNNRPHVGVGTSPTLKVTYENPQSKYMDFMPPDNRWFGQKKITIQIGNEVITRPVWFFFDAYAKRTLRQGGKVEAAWYHYFKESGAVPLMSVFEFDASMGHDVAGEYRPWSSNKFYLGFAAVSGAKIPIFDVNDPNSYTEEECPNGEGDGVHSVAKTCVHENWHRNLKRETRATWLFGGLGHPDVDGDGLSDAREAELGTKPNMKDTCGLSLYTDGPGDYREYASYADQELFCRWKTIGIKGDNTKDWSTCRLEREDLANQ